MLQYFVDFHWEKIEAMTIDAVLWNDAKISLINRIMVVANSPIRWGISLPSGSKLRSMSL